MSVSANSQQCFYTIRPVFRCYSHAASASIGAGSASSPISAAGTLPPAAAVSAKSCHLSLYCTSGYKVQHRVIVRGDIDSPRGLPPYTYPWKFLHASVASTTSLNCTTPLPLERVPSYRISARTTWPIVSNSSTRSSFVVDHGSCEM